MWLKTGNWQGGQEQTSWYNLSLMRLEPRKYPLMGGLPQLAYLRNPECPALSQDFTYELGATGVATHSEPRLVGQPLAEIQNPSGAETAKVERVSLERP